MSGQAHLTLEISQKHARDPLVALDWPGAARVPAGQMYAELVWVPFDGLGKRNRLERSSQPRFASLQLAAPLHVTRTVRSAPSKGQGRILDPQGEGEVLYAPFWILTAQDDSRGWAAVDAHLGVVVAGDLAAAEGPARMRLALMVGLAFLAVFMGGGVIYLIFDGLLMRAMELTPWVASFPALALMAALVWRLRSLLLPLFREPIARLCDLRIRLPLDREWLRLLRLFGLVFIMVALLEVYRLIQVAGIVHNHIRSFDDPVMVGCFGMARLLTACLVIRSALVTARGRWLTPAPQVPSSADRADGRRPSGRIADLVHTCLHVTILSMAGMLLGHLASQVMGGYGDRVDVALFMTRGAQAGALIGLHLGRLPLAARSALSVGLVAEGVGASLLGPWAAMGLTLAAVCLVDLPGDWRRRRGAGRLALWDASRSAWGFALGAICGRFLGQLCGVFVFAFFGVGGLVAGQVLGTLIGATIGYLSQRPRRESSPGVALAASPGEGL